MPPDGYSLTNHTLSATHFTKIHSHSKRTSSPTHYHKQYRANHQMGTLISPFNTKTMTRVLDSIQPRNRIPQSVRILTACSCAAYYSLLTTQQHSLLSYWLPTTCCSAYLPLYEKSLLFIAILVLSEFSQDLLIWQILVQERCLPRRMQVLTVNGRAWLKAKAYPPAFDSRAKLGAFLLPIISAGSATVPFVWSTTDTFVYVLNRTRT